MEGLGMEFYIYEDELWCKSDDGQNFQVDEEHTDIIAYILNNVRARYPEAYESLEKCYQKSALNIQYYKYLMARRFCKCNFGNLDSTEKDLENVRNDGVFNFEKVGCPLRGECPFDGKICMPKFDSSLSKAEYRVMKLFFDGKTKEEIGEELFVSPWTVKNQIKNAYYKLGVHSAAEFMKYANEHNLFKSIKP